MEYELMEAPHAPHVPEIHIEGQPGTLDPAVNLADERSRGGLR